MNTEELLLKLGGDASGAVDAVKKTGTSFEGLFATIAEGVVAGELLSHAMENVLEKLGEIPGELVELAERGSKVNDVEGAFQRLSGSIEASEATLQALRAGTRSTVDDFELMKTANKALSDGAKLSAEDFGVMAQGARLLAKQSGGETSDALETLNQAMVTGRTRALNLIGVHVSADEAMARYATTIGKSVADFTDQEKVAANSVEVMRQLKLRVSEAGDQQLSFAENVKVAKTRIENFEDALGQAIARSPVVAGAMNVINQAIDKAFGSGQQATIESVIQLIAGAGLAGARAASFIVEGAREIATAYESARSGVDGLFKAYNDKEIQRVEGALANMRAIAATSTTVTSASKLRVQELEVELARLKGTSDGYQQDLKAAEDSKQKLDQLAQSAQVFISQLAQQFAKTGGAAKEAGETAASAGAKIGDGFKQPSKDVTAFLDETRKLGLEFTNLETKVGTVRAVELLGSKFDAAREKAFELNVPLQALGATFVANDEKVRASQFDRMVLEQIARVKPGLESLSSELSKMGQDVTAELKREGELLDGAIAAHQRLTEQAVYGAQLRLAQIGDAEKKELESFAADRSTMGAVERQSYDQRIADTKAFYQHQRDVATGSASTIEERMRAAGISTIADLNTQAADAARDYAQMKASGEYSAAAIQAAWQRMVDASITANGGLSLSTGDMFKMLAQQATAALSQGGLKGLEHFGLEQAKGFVGTIAGAIPIIGPELQALAGPLMDLVGGFFKKIFSTAGRDAVKDFASSMGGFDALHQTLLTSLQGVGEDFWKQLTQEVARGDQAGAQAVIAKIQAALAGAPNALASAAGYQTKAELQAVADKAKQVYDYMLSSGQYTAAEIADAFKKMNDAIGAANDVTAGQTEAQTQAAAAVDATTKALVDLNQQGADTAAIGTEMWGKYQQAATDYYLALGQAAVAAGAMSQAEFDATASNIKTLTGQIDGLNKSIMAEAPEEVMGSVETQQRAQLAALQEQKEAAEKNLKDANDSIKDAADAAVNAAQDAAQKAGQAAVLALQNALDQAHLHTHLTLDGGTVPGASTGARVTAHGLDPLYRAFGGRVPSMAQFRAMGTDTVPAMLTPGELVLNTAQQGRLAGALSGGAGGVHIHDGAISIVVDRPILKDRDSINDLGAAIGLQFKEALAPLGLM